MPGGPLARDEMDDATFNAMMQTGLEQAKANRSRPVAEVFSELRQELM